MQSGIATQDQNKCLATHNVQCLAAGRTEKWPHHILNKEFSTILVTRPTVELAEDVDYKKNRVYFLWKTEESTSALSFNIFTNKRMIVTFKPDWTELLGVPTMKGG